MRQSAAVVVRRNAVAAGSRPHVVPVHTAKRMLYHHHYHYYFTYLLTYLLTYLHVLTNRVVD